MGEKSNKNTPKILKNKKIDSKKISEKPSAICLNSLANDWWFFG